MLAFLTTSYPPAASITQDACKSVRKIVLVTPSAMATRTMISSLVGFQHAVFAITLAGMPIESDPRAMSGIHRLRIAWQVRKAMNADSEALEALEDAAARVRWREEVVRRLDDPRRTPSAPPPLGMVRAVGLEQLSMQVIGSGSIDTQAGGVVAGAGALAAIDLALGGWLAVLVVAAISALYAFRTLLVSVPSTGPTPTQILAARSFDDEHGQNVLLDDDEAGWLVLGEIEVAINSNGALLQTRGKLVTRAIAALLVGIIVLVVLEAA